MAELIAEYFSPWSEKARWALDHHRVPYRFREYVPMLGEPWLRLRLRTLRGRVSVPVFLSDGAAFQDSFEIARQAERVGHGTRLMPPERFPEIMAWNARSEVALAAGRVGVVTRMGQVPGAKVEALPELIPEMLRPLLGHMVGMSLEFLRRKYGLGSDVEASHTTIRATLEELRGALAGRPHLFDQLSYADLAMAVVFQMIRPVSDTFIPLRPALRQVWSNEELARSFADLVEWRDRLYREHRRA